MELSILLASYIVKESHQPTIITPWVYGGRVIFIYIYKESYGSPGRLCPMDNLIYMVLGVGFSNSFMHYSTLALV